jgi:hypothetical protein
MKHGALSLDGLFAVDVLIACDESDNMKTQEIAMHKYIIEEEPPEGGRAAV